MMLASNQEEWFTNNAFIQDIEASQRLEISQRKCMESAWKGIWWEQSICAPSSSITGFTGYKYLNQGEMTYTMGLIKWSSMSHWVTWVTRKTLEYTWPLTETTSHDHADQRQDHSRLNEAALLFTLPVQGCPGIHATWDRFDWQLEPAR